MGRTLEALERAEAESNAIGPQVPLVSVSTRLQQGRKRLIPHRHLGRYQEVKTKLVNRFPQDAVKTILVTSAAEGEGVSTTAINLASALAQDCHLSVLLIDVNLRHPHQYKGLDSYRHNSLAAILTHEEPQKIFSENGPGNLHILAGGEKLPNALTLFESRQFDRFLKFARQKFAYVILDAPPVSSFSEFQVLGPKVDGVLFVVASGKTRRQAAIRAKKELEAAGAKILGIILNQRKHYIPKWIYRRL